MAVDTSHLYWVAGGTIVDANLDGTNPHTIATGQDEPDGLAVGPQRTLPGGSRLAVARA